MGKQEGKQEILNADSKEDQLDKLRPHLPEILKLAEQINEAKKDDKIILRRQFKNQFNVNFSQRLLEQLKMPAEIAEKAPAPEDLPELIDEKTTELIDEVADQKEIEGGAAVGLENNPEFNQQSGVIDDTRAEVVNTAVSEANKTAVKVQSNLKGRKIKPLAQIIAEQKEIRLKKKILKEKDSTLADIGTSWQEELRQAEQEEQENKNKEEIEKLRTEIKLAGAADHKGIELIKAGLGQAEISDDKNNKGDRIDADLPKVDSDQAEMKNNQSEAVSNKGIELIKAGLRQAEISDDKNNQSEAVSNKGIELIKAGLNRSKVSGEKYKDIDIESTRRKGIDLINLGLDASAARNQKNQKELNEINNKEIIPEALAIFYTLGLSIKDLKTIPGLENLNGVSQLIIAKSLKALALEKARAAVKNKQAQALVGKNFFGKLGAGFSNMFKSRKQGQEAIKNQETGGLEEHGADLVRLVDWNQMVDFQEQEIDKKITVNFLNGVNAEKLDNSQKQLVADFNKAANVLASMPKHWLVKFDSVPKKSEEYKHAEMYLSAQREYQALRVQLGNCLTNKLAMSEAEACQQMNDADAKLNMLQLMVANPDLEKDWSQLAKGQSVFGQSFKKENWKFMAGGYVGRMIIAAPLGIVAIPAVAAVVGAWRGRERAKKQIRETDKFIDKKDAAVSLILTRRREVLKEIQSLIPAEYSLTPKEWLQQADPVAVDYYQILQKEFLELDKKWRLEEQNNIERKTLKSVDLSTKLNSLLEKIELETDPDKKNLLSGQLRRRLDFNKDLADRGLVNFGGLEERTVNSLDFYQGLSRGELSLLKLNNDLSDEKLETFVLVKKGDKEDIYEKAKTFSEIRIAMQERAEELINVLEAAGDKKLDSRRHRFVVDKMLQGAALGSVFASLGASLHELTGHWVEDQMSAGYHFIKENSGLDSQFSAMEKIMASAASAVGEAKEEINNFLGIQNSVPVPVKLSGRNSGAVDTVGRDFLQPAKPKGSLSLEEFYKNQSLGGGTELKAAAASWSNEISNTGLRPGTHDSVWRSTREIFQNNAKDLGYQGDLNNSAALHHWAEIQTNKTLANSGEVIDKVFVGNRVILEKSGSGFVVHTESGAGHEPGFLPKQEIKMSAGIDKNLINKNPVISGDQPLTGPGKGMNEVWADRAGARLGFSTAEAAYADENVIQTQLGGHNIFINTETHTYYFFDDQGNEVSGLLIDDQGIPVPDAKGFLINKFKLISADDTDMPHVFGKNNQAENFFGQEDELAPKAPAAVKPSVNSQTAETIAAGHSKINSLNHLKNIETANPTDRPGANMPASFQSSRAETLNQNFKLADYGLSYGKDFQTGGMFNLIDKGSAASGFYCVKNGYKFEFYPRAQGGDTYAIFKINGQGDNVSYEEVRSGLVNDHILKGGAKNFINESIKDLNSNLTETVVAGNNYDHFLHSGALDRFNLSAKDFDSGKLQYFKSEVGEGFSVQAGKYEIDFYPNNNSYEIIATPGANQKMFGSKVIETGEIGLDSQANIDLDKFIGNVLRKLSPEK